MTNKIVTYEYKADQIDDAIVTLGKEAKTLQQKIHNIAASILMVWRHDSGTNGSNTVSLDEAFEASKVAVDRLNRLQAASPYHSNAFSKWVGMMTPCLWSEENKSWYTSKEDCRLTADAFTTARDTPFWTVSPPPTPKPFIMYLELERIVNKAVKHSGEKAVDGDAFNTEALNKVREAMDILKNSGLMPTE